MAAEIAEDPNEFEFKLFLLARSVRVVAAEIEAGRSEKGCGC